ncbi:MAG: hypothetical protein WDO15_23560 [Bacteroidota bacterium]
MNRDNGATTRFGPSRDLNKDGKVDLIYTSATNAITYSEKPVAPGWICSHWVNYGYVHAPGHTTKAQPERVLHSG